MSAEHDPAAILCLQASDSCAWRGHDMAAWEDVGDHVQRAACRTCGAEVDVNTRPMPNEVDVSGPAVALDCPVDDDPPHTGHFSRLGGTWWCDTCNSPYCELA